MDSTPPPSACARFLARRIRTILRLSFAIERLPARAMRTGVELSNAKTNGRTADGLAMLEWSVRQGIHFCSWSVETVYTGATRSLAQKMAAELPGSVAFGVFDGVNFGAPQNR